MKPFNNRVENNKSQTPYEVGGQSRELESGSIRFFNVGYLQENQVDMVIGGTGAEGGDRIEIHALKGGGWHFVMFDEQDNTILLAFSNSFNSTRVGVDQRGHTIVSKLNSNGIQLISDGRTLQVENNGGSSVFFLGRDDSLNLNNSERGQNREITRGKDAGPKAEIIKPPTEFRRRYHKKRSPAIPEIGGSGGFDRADLNHALYILSREADLKEVTKGEYKALDPKVVGFILGGAKVAYLEGIKGGEKYLVHVDSGGQVVSSLLVSGTEVITIGRAGDNDFVIPDISVSRKHAKIVLRGSGSDTFENLSNTNNTYIARKQ